MLKLILASCALAMGIVAYFLFFNTASSDGRVLATCGEYKRKVGFSTDACQCVLSELKEVYNSDSGKFDRMSKVVEKLSTGFSASPENFSYRDNFNEAMRFCGIKL